MEFITEMEEVEEILQNHWDTLISKPRERQLVQELFVKLREWQSTSHAALKAKDSFARLDDEVSSKMPVYRHPHTNLQVRVLLATATALDSKDSTAPAHKISKIEPHPDDLINLMR